MRRAKLNEPLRPPVRRCTRAASRRSWMRTTRQRWPRRLLFTSNSTSRPPSRALILMLELAPRPQVPEARTSGRLPPPPRASAEAGPRTTSASSASRTARERRGGGGRGGGGGGGPGGGGGGAPPPRRDRATVARHHRQLVGRRLVRVGGRLQ